MIQRIQSIFLLLAMIAWNILFFKPIMGFTTDAGGSWYLLASSIKESAGDGIVMTTIPLLVLLIIIDLLLLSALLLYRRRTLQLRVTLLSMILQIFSYGLIGLYVFFGVNKLDASAHLLFSTVMPLVAFVLTFLAFRGIRRDILLLKALERLR
ncbi:MAG: DUF4293 domain-containing protein [Bacteroidales bacterium]|nr:DUF4293 domain-containing protein [Bacteroidales bacterium]MDD2569839.1 DUF4293 domain-containing protein [Bacteroidales bacterium]MDD2811814.1 DUF4293 domain-containing protein [Bacteroidales bacterium]MDD3384726.1 DUF4293 domain-containing protein [Bacteroidales bacterium]MDD3810974.1 DUF4293 domain-containing protein [Bacteroidales bacterium]